MAKAQPEGNPAVVLTTRLDPFAAPPSGPSRPGRRVETFAALHTTLDLDERAVYEFVRSHGTIPAGTLQLRCKLSEGRARRAAQRLEARSILVRDGRDWTLA
jgi:hypothetical protein